MYRHGQNNRCVSFAKRPKSVHWRDVKNSKIENDTRFIPTTRLSIEKMVLILHIDISFRLLSESTPKIWKIRETCEKMEFSTTSERTLNSTALRCSLLDGTILVEFSIENWVQPCRFDTYLPLLWTLTSWTILSLQHGECSHLANLATVSFRMRFWTPIHHSSR